jgi:hypothetical protein
MISKLTADRVMEYQGTGLFLCAFGFALTHMTVPALIVLSWTLVGVYFQYKVRQKEGGKFGDKPSAAA